MDLSRYELVEEVFRSSRHAVYRARRRRSGGHVLLQTTGGEAEPGDSRRLERQFELLHGSPPPGLPPALEFVKGPDRSWIVLEDRGLQPLTHTVAGFCRNLPLFFKVASGLAGILGEIHRHDLVYGSLCAGTVLVGNAELQILPAGIAPFSSASFRRVVPEEFSAYMSPEQTGRINRAVDQRTDLYSLGILLYELLTGSVPFRTRDESELIHAHIAKVPASPSSLNPIVPEAVSQMVMKLLAKTPDDRYNTALGAGHDLERCAVEWNSTGSVSTFPLGRGDVSGRLHFQRTLYGRDAERQQLTSALESACGGSKIVIFVSGYSGSGKTALVQELQVPTIRSSGRFVSGRFDQVVRDIPYGALIPAFRSLVRQVLTENEERLNRVRQQLAETLGSNGGVLAEVIPEIELILGPQLPPTPLDSAESQNRFRYVLQNFIGTLAGKGEPLVIFLDDLQWADTATLELFHTLSTEPSIHHLLFVGAYRSNEVEEDHPLVRTIRRIEDAQASVGKLNLEPLARADLAQFLADTLHTPYADISALVDLTAQKTGGNPFFIIQFLKTLERDGLIAFDHNKGRWQFQLDAIARARITDNVVDLIHNSIQQLSPLGQRVLTLAACIGGEFQRDTLSMASKLAESDLDSGLAEALSAGLVQLSTRLMENGEPSQSLRYVFLHDRIQQAAYELIPSDQREACHLDLGRLLLAQFGGDISDERVFGIFNQLSTGRRLIVEDSECLDFARLALATARKAKSSTAYDAAASYLDAALDVLGRPSGSQVSTLAADLYLEAAECHYLAGHFEIAERYFGLLLSSSVDRLLRAQVHALRIVLYENQSRWVQAVQSGREGLAVFGMMFPEGNAEKAAALEHEVEAIRQILGGRAISSLTELPAMEDASVRMIMRILTVLWAPAYVMGDEVLARLISATMVRLSLEHGNIEDSAYGYVTHAITIGPIRADYAAAYEWGRLALAVNDQFRDPRHRAKIHQQFHAHVNLWRRPFETCIPHAREATRSGIEAGDFTYAGYGAATECWPAWVTNRDLNQFVREFTPHLALLDRLKISDFRQTLSLILNWAMALQGITSPRGSLSYGDFDEKHYVASFAIAAPFFMSFYYTARLHISVMLEDYAAAVDAMQRAREVTPAGTMWPVLIDFWGSLALAGRHASEPYGDDSPVLEQLKSAERRLAVLAENCPENYRCFALIVSAEVRNIEGQRVVALQVCEDALSYARQTENLQMEALANELCARLWLARGSEPLALPFLAAARQCYAAWGADLKVQQLAGRYAALLSSRDPLTPSEEIQTARWQAGVAPSLLDLSVVLKAAHAVAAEVEVDGLLRKLMKIALESAGADRGIFLQSSAQGLVVAAEAAADAEQVRLGSMVPVDLADLAHTVVRYVHRTGEAVVIGSASTDDRFRADHYIAAKNPRSILCFPVGPQGQGRQGGILYLENNITAEAFTPDRTQVIRVLAAQTAISLENARLYENTKAEVARRTEAEQALRQALAEVESLKNRLQAENVYLQEELRVQHNFDDIIGTSPVLLETLRKVERVAPTDSTVLILGETGSGKELIARAVHNRSRRRDRPLVKVNCGAIAPGLVESELFGHVKGAFTGAIDKRVGRFEIADGGTIFLDEIGELPLEAQVKLLRVLQEQEFEPVGGSRTVRVNVRVIAATNRDLDAAVREGRFRMDLLYRLNVVPIDVPPLRERASDVSLLAGFFLNTLSRRLGKKFTGFSERSMENFLRYPWPGNIRELQNIVERAAILASGPVLDVDPAYFGKASEPAAGLPPKSARDSLDDVQRSHIETVLRSTGGVVEGPRGAATILGLHPNTLRSRMKKLGISVSARHSN